MGSHNLCRFRGLFIVQLAHCIQRNAFRTFRNGIGGLAVVEYSLVNDVLNPGTYIVIQKFIVGHIRMNPVRQEYIDQVEFRINPQAGSGEASVPEGSARGVNPSRPVPVAGGFVPAQTSSAIIKLFLREQFYC